MKTQSSKNSNHLGDNVPQNFKRVNPRGRFKHSCHSVSVWTARTLMWAPGSVVNMELLSAACQNSGQPSTVVVYLDKIFLMEKSDSQGAMIHPNMWWASKGGRRGLSIECGSNGFIKEHWTEGTNTHTITFKHTLGLVKTSVLTYAVISFHSNMTNIFTQWLKLERWELSH